MADKIKELEERLDKLENRLKVTFLEIEKRLESFKQEQPMSIEDRLQELEDLLLLIQLEVTKLKDKTSLDFGVSAPAPDIAERLNKLEEAVMGEHLTSIAPEGHPPELHAASLELEQRLGEMEERLKHHSKIISEGGKTGTSDKLDDIEKRLDSIESRKIVSEKGVVISRKDVLEDVKKILYS